MMSCPYSERELRKWDSVCNPMGESCYDCEEYECEHNAAVMPGQYPPEEILVINMQSRPDPKNARSIRLPEGGE